MMVKVLVAVAFALFVAPTAPTVGIASATATGVAAVNVSVTADGGICSDCHSFGGSG